MALSAHSLKAWLPRFWLLAVLCLLAGCSSWNPFSKMRGQSPDDDDEGPEAKTMYIGDQVTIAGLHTLQIEGVGLVTNLDGTGGDPAPSLYRSLLLEDMRKRGVKNPNALLQSPSTALVLVRAVVPPIMEIGEHFDIEVVLPENADATSLAGGWLMETYLAEQAIVPGRGHMQGHILAKAKGPVLLSITEGEENNRNSGLKRGRILGGGVYLGGQLHQPRKLGLYLRNDYRSVRNSKRIAERIGRRFHYFDHGLKKPLAKATTDQHVELMVHPRYKQNYFRYLQVVRKIALHESKVEEHARIERLRKSLQVPQTASSSALELEALGEDSIPILKEGLASKNPEVRFYSADALAYLGSNAGLEELVTAARNEPAFRVYAMAALAVLDDGATHERLRELLNEPSAETRYSAFRALQTLDKNDPSIKGERVGDQFKLHPLRTSGEPMIHLTRYRTPEIVLFGADQRMKTPVALSAGRHIIINASPGSDTVTVSRFETNKQDKLRVVSTRVADIIFAAGELGASYPDIAQMLAQAQRQSNLPGRLEFDALPQPGRIYYRGNQDGDQLDDSLASTDLKKPSTGARKTRVGRSAWMPNMFPQVKATDNVAGSFDDSLDDDEESGKKKEVSDQDKLQDQDKSQGKDKDKGKDNGKDKGKDKDKGKSGTFEFDRSTSGEDKASDDKASDDKPGEASLTDIRTSSRSRPKRQPAANDRDDEVDDALLDSGDEERWWHKVFRNPFKGNDLPPQKDL